MPIVLFNYPLPTGSLHAAAHARILNGFRNAAALDKSENHPLHQRLPRCSKEGREESSTVSPQEQTTTTTTTTNHVLANVEVNASVQCSPLR